MKTRNSFVSNSSSSSFVLRKRFLTEEQIAKIRNHIEEAKKLNEILPLDKQFYISKDSEWNIEEAEEFIVAETFMDSFDMRRFVDDYLKIDPTAIFSWSRD
jgi:hypothetical protein